MIIWNHIIISIQLSCKRKKKDKACKEFGIIPNMKYCEKSSSKQNEYGKLEVNDKFKHENKIIKRLNTIVNHYSNINRIKNKIHKKH